MNRSLYCSKEMVLMSRGPPLAKHTFCEFEQEPGVYGSKAAVPLSYCLMNLEEERNTMRQKREDVRAVLIMQPFPDCFVFFNFIINPLTPTAWEGCSCPPCQALYQDHSYGRTFVLKVTASYVCIYFSFNSANSPFKFYFSPRLLQVDN